MALPPIDSQSASYQNILTARYLIKLTAQVKAWTAEIENQNKANFDPNQPRHPAGTSVGGQWRPTGSTPSPPRPTRKPNNSIPPKPVRKPRPHFKPHPHADSPYYDPETGIYDPPLNPTWSPFDFIGLPVAKPAASVIGSGARAAYNATRQAYNAARLQRYLSQARQIPKGVREAGKGTEHLTTGQQRSLKRFRGKGRDFKDPEVINYSDGSAIYSSKVPAANIPKSYALYEKHVDASGKIIRTNKIVIGPDGELIHIKPK